MLKLNGISKVYCENKPNQIMAVQRITMDITDGESVVLTGPSGSGKSTLLQIIGCISAASEGDYSVDGRDTATLGDKAFANLRNRKFGFILQNFGLIDYRNVFDNISVPLLLGGSASGASMKEKCAAALGRVGLGGYEKRKVWELSGGEKQRVAIARALVNAPDVILADEPTGALDSGNRDVVMGIFGAINAVGTTIVAVTHDLSLLPHFKRHIRLKDGSVAEDTTI
jgi:putative ABC transport system ATP-binding protein